MYYDIEANKCVTTEQLYQEYLMHKREGAIDDSMTFLEFLFVSMASNGGTLTLKGER